MTQAIDSTDLAVAVLQESVRHNEKNIDKPDRDRRPGLPPLSDRTTTELAVSPAGRTITVIRG